MPLIDVPPIHAVTDSRILSVPGFVDRAGAVFRALGAAGAVHLRGPGLGGQLLHAIAMDLIRLEEVTGCRLIINDRADIARAVGAWGIQLGVRSMAPEDVRRVAPRQRIGVSVHSMEEATAARAGGADWLFAGHIHETPSHAGVAPAGPELVSALAPLGVPVIAIGGVEPGHVSDLRARGAHGVAAIRGIWDAADPGAAADAYLQMS